MKMDEQLKPKEAKKRMKKEVLVGLISLGLGTYNLLIQFGLVNINIKAPEILGSVLLVLAGIFLLTQAYKISRHEYHIKRSFRM